MEIALCFLTLFAMEHTIYQLHSPIINILKLDNAHYFFSSCSVALNLSLSIILQCSKCRCILWNIQTSPARIGKSILITWIFYTHVLIYGFAYLIFLWLSVSFKKKPQWQNFNISGFFTVTVSMKLHMDFHFILWRSTKDEWRLNL